jgi:hypothetical protein
MVRSCLAVQKIHDPDEPVKCERCSRAALVMLQLEPEQWTPLCAECFTLVRQDFGEAVTLRNQ